MLVRFFPQHQIFQQKRQYILRISSCNLILLLVSHGKLNCCFTSFSSLKPYINGPAKLIQCIKFSFSLTAGARFWWINNKSVPHSSSVFACSGGKNTCVPSIVYRWKFLAETVTSPGLRGIYITLGYTFWRSMENFSAYSQVLRGSILLPPRHPSVFARSFARWQ